MIYFLNETTFQRGKNTSIFDQSIHLFHFCFFYEMIWFTILIIVKKNDFIFQISHADLSKIRQRSSMAVRKLSSPDTSTYHYSNVVGNNKISNKSKLLSAKNVSACGIFVAVHVYLSQLNELI